MSPPEKHSGLYTNVYASAAFRAAPICQTSEPKRMKFGDASVSDRSLSANNYTSFGGALTPLTNEGPDYKAQLERAVNAAIVKAKAPTHRRRGRKGKSIYRGVCVTREGKWRAVIYKERKQLYLGVYESEVDAAKAHDRAARFHFAQDAVCNFVDDHEADHEMFLCKQRHVVQQQQTAEDRAHRITLYGNDFVAGREEFDDLDEYHRGLEIEGAPWSEEGDGVMERDGEEEMSTLEETRSTRSLSTSSSTSVSTSVSTSMSASTSFDHALFSDNSSRQPSSTIGNCHGFDYCSQQYERAAAMKAAMTDIISVDSGVNGDALGAVLYHDGGVNANRAVMETGHSIQSNHNYEHRRGVSSGSSEDSDNSELSSMSILLEGLEPAPLEGMGFPYAEGLLGYEVQSSYSCQDDDLSPTSTGSGFVVPPMPHRKHPVAGRQLQQVASERGMGIEQTIAELEKNSSQGSSSVCLSLGGFSSSDDKYLPSALPPLMGICADS